MQCTGYSADTFRSRETLSRWVYDLHSCVNRMLGKPNKYTYEQARTRFENFRARCREPEARRAGGGQRKPAVEGGCTDPVSGLKSRCTLMIEPCADDAGAHAETMRIDARCICRK
jgi:hypothetical protein